jgi:hypothetical protein
MTAPTRASDALGQYLEQLVGPEPAGRLLEIRYVTGSGMGRLFVPARRLDLARRAILPLGERTDVYCGVLLRTRRAGGRDAVADSHLVWVDLDTPDALARLDRFAIPASMRVLTGTPGHAHAYWILTTPIDPWTVEQVNRRLALTLSGDPASVDRARILRPGGSRSHKHRPSVPVQLERLDPAARDLGELLDALDPLPEPNGARPPARPRRRGRPARALDDELLRIPACVYVQHLTGLAPNRAGKVSCPFHPDRTPSLQLYEDGSWYCFGACQAGGSIYDFAARLWLSEQSGGAALRGRQFLELRDRLAATLSLQVR